MSEDYKAQKEMFRRIVFEVLREAANAFGQETGRIIGEECGFYTWLQENERRFDKNFKEAKPEGVFRAHFGRRGLKETGFDVVVVMRERDDELVRAIDHAIQMENRRRVRHGGSRLDYAFQILEESTSSSGS